MVHTQQTACEKAQVYKRLVCLCKEKAASATEVLRA